MKRLYAIYALILLFAIGCERLRPVTPPIAVGQRTVTVSGDDPFIDIETGRGSVLNGVPSGQSEQFKLTQYRDGSGKLVLDVDTVSESMPELEQP